MISDDRLNAYRDGAISSVEVKLKGAKEGHGWSVLNETICSFDLIEMTSELLKFREKFGEFEGIKK